MADVTLTLNAQNGTIIDGQMFQSSTGNCITLTNCQNITIKNCTFVTCLLTCIRLDNCQNVTIYGNSFNDMGAGIVAVLSSGVKVFSNKFKNVTRRVTGNNGQFVQFNKVTGSGNIVSNNFGVNIAGLSAPEDLISMYASAGTLSNPIIIEGNVLSGGGPSTSGGGIMLGDNGGDSIIAKNNILISPGQYGMTIAGGTNMTIQNNMVYSKQTTVSNVGISTWAQGGFTADKATVKDNIVQWYNKANILNNYWNQGNVTNLVYTNNRTGDLSQLLIPAF